MITMSSLKKQIVVVGNNVTGSEVYALAYEVGSEIAKKGYVLICGGRGGVMEAACKGAKKNKGLTVGIFTRTRCK